MLCIAAMACIAGCKRAGSPNQPSGEPVTAKNAHFTFTDVTVKAGLGGFKHSSGATGMKWLPESVGSGGGFLDYDGDGWLDILLVGGGTWKDSEDVTPLWLYRNNRDGTFSLRSEEMGLEDTSAYGFGVTAADFDNDGDQDIYLTALKKNLFFRNDDSLFTEIAEEAGVAGESVWSTAAIFFDADRDGYLDLYVGNYVDWTPESDVWCSVDGRTKAYCTPDVYGGVHGRFYLNNGNGTFTDATSDAGVSPGIGKTLGVAELDFNSDGWPDLVVSNDLERNLLYENRGDGTFSERGRSSGVAYSQTGRARAGMGIDVGDVGNSGKTWIFIGNFSNEAIGAFRHEANGLFVDRAPLAQLTRPSLPVLTFGLFLFDVDLDGDLDLFAANGHLQEQIQHVQNNVSYRQPSHLYLNDGNSTFTEVGRSMDGTLRDSLVARGAAYGDFDRDGDLDVLVTENDGQAHLWRNESASDVNYLRVKLQGEESSRDGIGARLVAVVDSLRMVRSLTTGSSYLSQSEKVVTFGLGTSSRVDSLTVYWPSGKLTRRANIRGNQEILVAE